MRYTYKYYFQPRYTDLDYYVIAHHSKFMVWFEEARFECFKEYKDKFEKLLNKYKLPVTKLECKYRQMVAEIKPMVVVLTIDTEMDIPILHFEYKLMDADEKKLYANAYTEHAFVSEKGMETEIPIELKELLQEITEKYKMAV